VPSEKQNNDYKIELKQCLKLIFRQNGIKFTLNHLQITTKTHSKRIGQLPLDKELYLISEDTFKIVEAELQKHTFFLVLAAVFTRTEEINTEYSMPNFKNCLWPNECIYVVSTMLICDSISS
jgi:hypothetical protein